MENFLLSSYLQYIWKITLRVLLVAITKLCEASKKKITACDLEMDERFFPIYFHLPVSSTAVPPGT